MIQRFGEENHRREASLDARCRFWQVILAHIFKSTKKRVDRGLCAGEGVGVSGEIEEL